MAKFSRTSYDGQPQTAIRSKSSDSLHVKVPCKSGTQPLLVRLWAHQKVVMPFLRNRTWECKAVTSQTRSMEVSAQLQISGFLLVLHLPISSKIWKRSHVPCSCWQYLVHVTVSCSRLLMFHIFAPKSWRLQNRLSDMILLEYHLRAAKTEGSQKNCLILFHKQRRIFWVSCVFISFQHTSFCSHSWLVVSTPNWKMCSSTNQSFVNKLRKISNMSFKTTNQP